MKIFKKIIILCLILAMFFCIMPKREYAAETLKIGDINGDGIIDSRDTLRILEHIAASTITKIKQKYPNWILTNEKLKCADINQDGIIDSRDTLRELEYIAATSIPTIAQKHPNWKTYVQSKWIIDASGITLDKTNITIEAGKLSKLVATISPPNANNKVVTWSSSDTKVATVDGLGNIEGKNEGIAIITATTKNGKNAKCQVKVTPSIKNISNLNVVLNPTAVTYNGKAQTPTVTIQDGNATLRNGTDYTITYSNNINAGIAKVIVTGKGNYIGTLTKTFTINKANYNTNNINFTDSTVTYDGNAHSITATGIPSGIQVTYTGNGRVAVGTYSITASFTVNNANYNAIPNKTAVLRINPKLITTLSITGIADKTYTGKAITQSIVVKDGNLTLSNGTHYIVTYANNINVGTASVTITGKGNYAGAVTKLFNIKAIEKKYYVSKNGSDSNSGTSASKPLKTISKGLSKVSAGYTLVINSGKYSENGLTLSKKGTSANPIRIVANGNVVIDGSGKKRILKIKNSENIIIDGITFQNLNADDAKGILIEPSSKNIFISNCKFNNIKTKHPKNEDDGASAIFINGSSSTAINGITITNCTLTNIGAGYSEAISVDGNCANINITGVTVTYTNGLKGNIGICICGNYGTCSNKSLDRPRNVTISNCNVSNCKSPYGDDAYGIYVDGGKDVTISNNTVSNCEGGIEVGAEVKNSKLSGKETENVKVLNNTIKNCNIGAQIGGWDGKATVYNVLFDKNTLLNCGKNGGKAIEFSKCKKVTISNCKFNTSKSKWFEGSSMAKDVTKKNNIQTK